MTDNISGEQRAAMIGEVIISARQVESRLHELCGNTEVTGIHALTELLSGRLPEEIKRQLHFIAAVRNSAAHEADFIQSAEDFQRFRQCCQNTLETLQRLFPETPQVQDNAAGNMLDVAVERELFAALTGKVAKLGYIPLAGNIYLLYILLYTVFQQGFMLLLAGLYCCSAVLGIKGWQSSADRGLLYVAAGAMLFAYIATTFLSFYAPVKKLPKVIGILPGVNIIYLLIRFLRDLKWGRFLTSLLGLAALTGSIVLFCRNTYNYAVALLILNFITGIIAAIIWGRKSEK
ncbi:MAG: hypothetical protein E7039_05530 [Lentisphaerae bacterium]|nr:hypothetical protein [Lentisphaerota bacterium]